MSHKRGIWAGLRLSAMWGCAWGAVGAGMQAYSMLRFYLTNRNTGSYQYSSIAGAFLVGSIVGTLAGFLFTSLFARLERGRNIGTLSWWRAVAWGGIAGVCFLSVPLVLRFVLTNGLDMHGFARMAAWYLGLGAGTAGAMIGVAKLGKALPSEEDVIDLQPAGSPPERLSK